MEMAIKRARGKNYKRPNFGHKIPIFILLFALSLKKLFARQFRLNIVVKLGLNFCL